MTSYYGSSSFRKIVGTETPVSFRCQNIGGTALERSSAYKFHLKAQQPMQRKSRFKVSVSLAPNHIRLFTTMKKFEPIERLSMTFTANGKRQK